ncbi:MAG: PD-(D/E)XK nuclease family protein, partial [Candidatus Ratteibacteria bacterium]|nr:PD-(D/E)XK nuclease family protein [Candidatus Ratteibacteria bacterium]
KKTNLKTEVPIYFEKDKARLLKRIDRLIIRGNLMEIIDYKTGLSSEYDNSAIKKQYIKQMRDYRIAVSKIYPDKEVKCYLVWLNELRGKRIKRMKL